MKIVHVISDLSYGGIPKICIDSCNFLCETNEVFLISLCRYNQGMLPLASINSKIQFINFDKRKGINLWLIWQMYRKLKILNPDILHTHTVGLFYSILYILTHPNSRFFFTVHSLVDKGTPFYYRFFYKRLFRFFKVRAIPISKAVQESFTRVYKLETERIIYNGVKLEQKGFPNEMVIREVEGYKKLRSTHVFVNLARIAEEKNQYLLVESFNMLVEKKSDVLLLIIGSAKQNTLLNKLKNIAGPNIYFLGAKNNVGDYFKMADAFCLTSVYEGLSLATIEALAMKVIPICTPVGGVPEVVQDGYNGILSEDCTITAYLNALKRFLSMSEQEKKVMRENGYQTYQERFTIERCGEEHLELYNAALQGKL